MDFGELIKLGGTVLAGNTFLCVKSLSPPVCLMSLRVLMSWFLNLVVGSLLIFLKVSVSDSKLSALSM